MLHSFLVLALCSPLAAPPQEPVPAETKPRTLTAQERFDAIQQEYDDATRAFWKELREKPDDEQEAFYGERPRPDAFVPRFLELAAAYPGTEVAASSLLWVARNSEDDEAVSSALDVLIADHVDSESMAKACSLLMRNYEVGEKYLKQILERSSNPEVKGNACFYLGKYYMSCSGLANTLSSASEEQHEAYVGYLGGEEVVARITAMEPAELQKEGETCFERVLAEYADVGYRNVTLGEVAENNLFQIRSLQVGMIAPDIEGEDVFGSSFQVSDYRGKVVVLDFWGNW